MTLADRSTLFFILASIGLAATLAGQQPPSRPFDVLGYAADIKPDMAAKTVAARVTITFVGNVDELPVVDLDAGDLIIDAVRTGNVEQPFVRDGRRLSVSLVPPPRSGERRAIDVEYHGAPRSGVQFHPERSQVYTIFSTSQWLVSVDAPGERATLQLSVVLPRGLRVVDSGEERSARQQANGSVVHEWRLGRPAPSYTFGFAAGPFVDVRALDGRLRFLGAGFTEPELAQIFRDSADMLQFFEARAGVPYGDRVYTQALVASTAGQEMSGFSLLSDEYGRSVLADPRAITLGAHELAHQWWGNRITCRDWTDFWLNEGFATFMAAAYKEHRFGREEYLREVEQSRLRYEAVRSAGGDKPLVFPDWARPTANDWTLVYHKGAYVLHLLREKLGDEPFWAAIRHYTRTYLDRSVTTQDFQAAVEQSSGTGLSTFFEEWIAF